MAAARKELSGEVAFWEYVQRLFFAQWWGLKESQHVKAVLVEEGVVHPLRGAPPVLALIFLWLQQAPRSGRRPAAPTPGQSMKRVKRREKSGN